MKNCLICLLIMASYAVAESSEQDCQSKIAELEAKIKVLEATIESQEKELAHLKVLGKSSEYRILAKELTNYTGIPCMTYKVLVEVNRIPADDKLKKIAIELWENGNKQWANFTVLLYLSDMNPHLAAYGIGWFGPDGLKKFKTQDYALNETKWRNIKQQQAADSNSASKPFIIDGLAFESEQDYLEYKERQKRWVQEQKNLSSTKSQVDMRVQAYIKEGWIKEITEFNEVYVSPEFWDAVDYRQKETFARDLAIYCGKKNKYKEWVEIKDFQSGKKLAKYSVWGFKVY